MGKIKSVLSYPLRHKKISIPLIIVIILAAIFWPRPPEPLETQTVKREEITEILSTSGTVTADPSVNLSFLINGKLIYLGAKKGDHVNKGQVIARLDERQAQKTIESRLKDFRSQLNMLLQLKEDEDFDPNDTGEDIDTRRTVENSQNELDKTVLEVEIQNITKEQSVLTSPIAGTLIRSDVTAAGVNVTPSTVFTVADLDNLVFEVEIDEADIGRVQVGQPVKVTINAFPDQSHELTVTKIDYATHTTASGGNAYNVTMELPKNLEKTYRIGMNGDAEIIIAKKTNTLVVSLSSLTDDESVYVQGEEDTFVKRKVKTGIQSDTEIEVLSGLREGEVVALQPDEAAKRMQEAKKQFFFF